MKWNWKIGTFAGIDVFVHASFLLIIVWTGFSSWMQTRALSGTIEGILFTLALFGCVVLHEFGHALTARRYGVKTRDITLYPIGGVARLERMPDKPVQEFWVSLAGPAVNIGIAILLSAWLVISGSWAPLANLSITTGPFIERLLMINLFLVAFNLIPAFPMDGGRVLRSVLAMRMEYTRATQIAATVGRGLALVFGAVGLFTNPFLVLIALFVFVGATQEASMVQMKAALAGVPVERAMRSDVQTLSPQDWLGRAATLIQTSSQTDFPVLSGGAVVGMLARNDILSGLVRQGQYVSVSEIMRRDFQAADPNEMLETAIARLQANETQSMPVVYRAQLVGLLTMEGIGNFIKIQSAIGRPNRKEQVLDIKFAAKS